MQGTSSSLGNQIVGQSVFALPKCSDEDFTGSQQRNVFLNAYIYMYVYMCVYIYAFICIYNICYILHIYIERELYLFFSSKFARV